MFRVETFPHTLLHFVSFRASQYLQFLFLHFDSYQIMFQVVTEFCLIGCFHHPYGQKFRPQTCVQNISLTFSTFTHHFDSVPPSSNHLSMQIAFLQPAACTITCTIIKYPLNLLSSRNNICISGKIVWQKIFIPQTNDSDVK